MPATLVNRLREERENRGWTQGELAARSGFSRKTVNTIENRVIVPSALVALKIAAALGVPFEQLFWIEESGG